MLDIIKQTKDSNFLKQIIFLNIFNSRFFVKVQLLSAFPLLMMQCAALDANTACDIGSSECACASENTGSAGDTCQSKVLDKEKILINLRKQWLVWTYD